MSGPDPRLQVVRLPEVLKRTGLSRSTIYSRIEAGTWPPGFSLGARAIGWTEFELEQMLRSIIAGHDLEQQKRTVMMLLYNRRRIAETKLQAVSS